MLRRMQPAAPPTPNPRVRLGAVLGINQTLSWGMTFYLPAIVAGRAAESLNAAPSLILGAFSWSLLVSGFCAPRVGHWIDTHGGRGALLASIVVIAVGQAVLAVAPNLAIWAPRLDRDRRRHGDGACYDAAFATVGGLLKQEMRGRPSPASRCSRASRVRCSGPSARC